MSRLVMGALLAALSSTVSVSLAFAAEPAQLISSFRLKYGEVRVTTDATLNRIAMEQAKAMAARDQLDHGVLGPFSSRIEPSHAGRAAENIAYGYDTFDKTLEQWIDSSEHRKNLLLHNASRVGIASAKDASGRRTYWAMVIAGDFEPKRTMAKTKKTSPVVKRAAASADCHIKVLSLCL